MKTITQNTLVVWAISILTLNTAITFKMLDYHLKQPHSGAYEKEHIKLYSQNEINLMIKNIEQKIDMVLDKQKE